MWIKKNIYVKLFNIMMYYCIWALLLTFQWKFKFMKSFNAEAWHFLQKFLTRGLWSNSATPLTKDPLPDILNERS